MENIKSRIIHAFEIVAALMMAAMFATFILQVTIRYTARAEWIKDIFPFLDPTLYGWTRDFQYRLPVFQSRPSQRLGLT